MLDTLNDFYLITSPSLLFSHLNICLHLSLSLSPQFSPQLFQCVRPTLVYSFTYLAILKNFRLTQFNRAECLLQVLHDMLTLMASIKKLLLYMIPLLCSLQRLLYALVNKVEMSVTVSTETLFW